MNKTASVGVDIFRDHVDVRKWYAIQKALKAANDDQSLALMRKIQDYFVKKFDLKSGEEQGWYRLLNMVRDGSRWDVALLRNNVFKVANSLGMSLPSGMFASQQRTALEQAWGPTIRQAKADR